MKKNLGGVMKKDNEKEKSYSEIMEVYMFKKLEDGNVCEQYIQQRYENELGMWTDIKGAAKATRRHKNTIYNMARNNLNVVKISARQDEISIEEEVIMTVSDFNIQQQLIASAEEALDLSILAYNETKQRFIIGKADINSLTLSLNRQQQAQRNFISALQNYWLNYYKIRRLTLFDFAAKLSLSDRFDFNGGKLVK